MRSWHDPTSKQSFLVVANLHGKETLRDIRILLPPQAVEALSIANGDAKLEFRDRLATKNPIELKTTARALRESGLDLPPLPPLSAAHFELRH